MIPKKPTKKAGPKTRVIGFKPEPDVLQYLEEMRNGGTEMTETLMRAVRLARDASAVLGVEDWAEIEKRAKVRGCGDGTVLGEAAALALKSERITGFDASPKKGGKG